MYLLTKAVILLIVTNSMASSYQSNGLQKAITSRTQWTQEMLEKLSVNCSESHEMERNIMEFCERQKWGVTAQDMVNALFSDEKPEPKTCCWVGKAFDLLSNFNKKNCEVKDGYEALMQDIKRDVKDKCTKAGLNPDCNSLIQSVPKLCHKCNSADKQNMVQIWALIVLSFVSIFIFY